MNCIKFSLYQLKKQMVKDLPIVVIKIRMKISKENYP